MSRATFREWNNAHKVKCISHALRAKCGRRIVHRDPSSRQTRQSAADKYAHHGVDARERVIDYAEDGEERRAKRETLARQ